MFVFRKIWCALVSCYLRFEIRRFALLSTKFTYEILERKISMIFTDSEGINSNLFDDFSSIIYSSTKKVISTMTFVTK